MTNHPDKTWLEARLQSILQKTDANGEPVYGRQDVVEVYPVILLSTLESRAPTPGEMIVLEQLVALLELEEETDEQKIKAAIDGYMADVVARSALAREVLQVVSKEVPSRALDRAAKGFQRFSDARMTFALNEPRRGKPVGSLLVTRPMRI